MDVGGFPVDLILFGMIAGFLVLRLRSILGRRTGFERPPAHPFQGPSQSPNAPPVGPVIEGRAEPVAASDRTLPDPASPVGHALLAMRGIDHGFDPGAFLSGAEKAFRMIVAAFAGGDRDTLRKLVAEDVYKAFDQAITERERAGHKQVGDVREIPSATIETAELKGTSGQITVKFVSDQISMTVDGMGKPVAGTDAVTEMVDAWTFERDLSAQDPTWRLIAVRPA